MGLMDERRGNVGGDEGRVSALDLGATGATPPTMGTRRAPAGIPTTAPAAARAPAGAVDIVEGAAAVLDAVRATLPDDVMVALLDAPPEGVTVDDVHEAVNVTGEHVARGPVEKELLALVDAKTAVREGDRYRLTADARGLYENPAVIVARRASILATLAWALGDSLGACNGETLAGLHAGLTAPAFEGEATGDEDEDSAETGALTLAGFAPLAIALDVLERDLRALVDVGVLVERTFDEEFAVRGAPEDDEDDEQADLRASVYYTFAPGELARFFVTGATALVTPSVPSAVQAVTDAARASSSDRSGFELRAAEDLTAERAAHKIAELRLERLGADLRRRGLGYIFDESAAPVPVEVDDELRVYTMTLTRRMDDAERAALLRDITANDRAIREQEAVLEGSKALAKATKAAVEEKLPSLKDKQRDLFAMQDAPERTYELDVFDEFHPDGDARSGGKPVLYRRASVGKRIVERETLTPARALELHAARGVLAISGIELDPGDVPEKLVKGRPMAAAAEVLATTPGVLSPSAAVAKRAGDAADALREAATKAGARVMLHMDGATASLGGEPAEDFDAIVTRQAADAAAKGGAGSKPRITLNVTALRPVALAVLAAAGPAGALELDLPGLVAAYGGIEAGASLVALVKRVAGQFGPADVERREGRLVYPMRPVVLALVAAAGDMGLRTADLGAAFTERTGIEVNEGVQAHLDAAAVEAVLANDLDEGALGGDLGDLLWISGQPDPRTLGTTGQAAKGRKAAAKRPRAKRAE